MSNELAIIGQDNTALTTANAPTGLGRTGTSRLMSFTPATLGIVQPNSSIDGAIKGNLIIDGDSDLQFKEMIVTLLLEPEEQRAYYVGEAGGLNRTPENLHCFSRDLVAPDVRAKFPQSLTCKNCPKQSWEQFRMKRDKGIPTTKDDIPPCDAFFLATLMDTQYKMPLRMYIRSQSKDPFEAGMKKITRKLMMLGAVKGVTPNIFDVSFRLSTKQVTKGKFTFYVLNIDQVEGITDEQKASFGVVFEQFIAAQTQAATQRVAAQEAKALEAQTGDTDASTDSVAAGVLEGDYEVDIPL